MKDDNVIDNRKIELDNLFQEFGRAIDEYCNTVSSETITSTGKVIVRPLNMTNATQLQFNGLMMYIYSHCIKDKYSLLIDDNDRKDGIYNNSTWNTYSIYKIYNIYNWFTNCSSMYDKVPTVYAFSQLVGINDNVFYSWQYGKKDNTELNHARLDFINTIRHNEEYSYNAMLVNGKRNNLGVITLLNYHYGYSASIASKETTAKLDALPANALPTLTGRAQHAIAADTDTAQ